MHRAASRPSIQGRHAARRRVLRAVAPFLLALLVLAQLPLPTTGEHAGRPIGSMGECRQDREPPRCRSVGNTVRHFVYFDPSLTEGLASSLRDTMFEDYDPTALIMYEQTSINAATDVIAFSRDYGDNGAAGWVNCPADAPRGTNEHGHRWCQLQELHINLNPSLSVYTADDGSRDHIMCHELGHTLGLGHWGNPPQTAGPAAATCMTANTPDGATGLDRIDRNHIDAYYAPPVVRPRNAVRHSIVRAEPAHAATAWSGGVRATELESYTSLAGMTAAADAVVVGRITAVDAGRVFGDPAQDALHYAAATVEVGELLAGALPGAHARTLTLEIPLFNGPESVADLRASLVGEEAILFLRSKDERDYYRLVVLDGAISNENGLADDGADAVPGIPAGASFDEASDVVRAATP